MLTLRCACSNTVICYSLTACYELDIIAAQLKSLINWHKSWANYYIELMWNGRAQKEEE